MATTEEKKPNLNDIRYTKNIIEIDDPEEVDNLISDNLHIHDEKGEHVQTIVGKDNIRNYLIMRKYTEHMITEQKYKNKMKQFEEDRKG